MAVVRFYPTGRVGLWYAPVQVSRKGKVVTVWRFADERTRELIGSEYPDKISLLAAAAAFADANGYSHHVNVRAGAITETASVAAPARKEAEPTEKIMPGGSVEMLWLRFWSRVAPAGCSDAQRSDMRKAFYAGAVALLAVLERIGDDDVSEDAGAEWLEALKLEVRTVLRR